MKYSSAGWLPWKLSYGRETQKDKITNYFVYKMEVSENDVTRTGVQRTGNVKKRIFKFLIVKWKEATVGYFKLSKEDGNDCRVNGEFTHNIFSFSKQGQLDIGLTHTKEFLMFSDFLADFCNVFSIYNHSWIRADY